MMHPGIVPTPGGYFKKQNNEGFEELVSAVSTLQFIRLFALIILVMSTRCSSTRNICLILQY